MGWYFRRAIGFGPFRLNLSKSGLGWSVGVTHAGDEPPMPRFPVRASATAPQVREVRNTVVFSSSWESP
jgi:hypothetical protein